MYMSSVSAHGKAKKRKKHYKQENLLSFDIQIRLFRPGMRSNQYKAVRLHITISN